MTFAFFDPSLLTVYINCSFFTFIFAVLLPVLSRLLIISINTTFSIFQHGGRPVGTGKKVEQRHCAKFRRNRLNRGCHPEKIRKSRYLGNGLTDRHNIWHDDPHLPS